MTRCSRLALVAAAVVVLAACGGDDDSDDLPSAWTESGLAEVESVAADVRAAGLACDGYSVYDFDVTVSSNPLLPVPAAMAACTSDADEGLEIVAFASGGDKEEFVTAKQDLLCSRAAEVGAPFPGFPLVDGGAWTIQPDEPATADTLAAAIGAESRFVDCD